MNVPYYTLTSGRSTGYYSILSTSLPSSDIGLGRNTVLGAGYPTKTPEAWWMASAMRLSTSRTQE